MTRPASNTLRRFPLFRRVSRRELATVLRLAQAHEMKRGERITHQRHPAKRVYMLLRGSIKLIRARPSGRESIVTFLGPTDIFGHLSVLAHTSYYYSAQAIGDGEVISWPAGTMLRLMRQHPIIAINCLRMVAHGLEEEFERIQDCLVAERVERRLARTLLWLARRIVGRREKGPIMLPVLHVDIARFIGSTSPTVSRILRRWERAGIIESGREKILIRNRRRLTVVAAR